MMFRCSGIFAVIVTVSVVVAAILIDAVSIHKSPHANRYHRAESRDDGGIAWTGGKRVSEQYQVRWSYDPTREEITFEITAAVTGYVGLGITESGSMRDADIFLAWVKHGKPFLLDCHGPLGGNGAPVVDDSNNLHLISGHEAEGVTTVRFKRKLRTCDSDGNRGQDIDIDSNTARMLFAYSDKEPNTDAITSVPYSLQHERSERGHFDTHLLSAKPPTPDIEPDAITLDIRLNNITVPASETTYWCDVFKINRTEDLNGRKHHLIMSHVIIGGHKEVNAPYVHHLVMHRCHRFPANWSLADERPGGGLCYDGGSPMALMCLNDEIIAAWAVGGEEFYYPADVGLPVGDEEVEYYVVDMHYDNPSMATGIVDDSGVRLLLTPSRRRHEAGTMVSGVGAHFHMFVPPGVPDFLIEGTCHMNCTRQSLPDSGVTVFAGLLHTHLLGHAVTVRHIREGVELPHILRDTKYDFNYQDIIRLQETVQLLPGDAVRTECIYDSTDKDMVTWGGLGTREEMCASFLYYYPRSPISICVTMYPDPVWFANALGVHKLYPNPDAYGDILSGPAGPLVEVEGVGNTTWVEYVEGGPALGLFQWDEATVGEVQRVGLTAQRAYMCNDITNIWMSGPVNISTAYTAPTAVPCSGGTSTTTPGLTSLLLCVMLLCALLHRTSTSQQ